MQLHSPPRGSHQSRGDDPAELRSVQVLWSARECLYTPSAEPAPSLVSSRRPHKCSQRSPSSFEISELAESGSACVEAANWTWNTASTTPLINLVITIIQFVICTIPYAIYNTSQTWHCRNNVQSLSMVQCAWNHTLHERHDRLASFPGLFSTRTHTHTHSHAHTHTQTQTHTHTHTVFFRAFRGGNFPP